MTLEINKDEHNCICCALAKMKFEDCASDKNKIIANELIKKLGELLAEEYKKEGR